MEVHYPINTKNAILLSRVKAIAYTWKKKRKIQAVDSWNSNSILY